MVANFKSIYKSLFAAVALFPFIAAANSLPVFSSPQTRDTSHQVTFSLLKRDIVTNHIGSSEELLEYFDSSPVYKPFLENVLLERESDALHGDDVSPKFPRILMHEGNLVIHLIGDPTKPGRELIEVAEFEPDHGRFAFSVINFALSGSDSEFLEDIEFKTKITSDVQAAYEKTVGQFFSCGACHTPTPNSLLPVWSPRSSIFKAYSDGDDKIPSAAGEAKEFRDFIKIKNDPHLGKLYRWLRINYREDQAGNIEFPSRPVQLFTTHLHDKIRRRLAFQIRRSPRYRQLQYASVGAFFNCEHFENFFSASYQREHEARLLTASNDYYPLPLGRINTDKLDPSFQKDVEVSHGNFAYLIPAGSKIMRESAFLKHSLAPLADGLTLKPEHSSEVLSFFSGRRMSILSLQAAIRSEEKEFISREYIETIGKLRYVLDGEIPGNFSPFDEFDVHGGHPHVSYRLDGGFEGLTEVLSSHLGPDFLNDNPDLNYFKDGVMRPRSLTIPLPEYCALLQAKSLTATAQ